MTSQDLITHQAQLIFRETTQISRIEQHACDDITDGLLFRPFLLSLTILQIIRCKHKNL